MSVIHNAKEFLFTVKIIIMAMFIGPFLPFMKRDGHGGGSGELGVFLIGLSAWLVVMTITVIALVSYMIWA